MEANVVTEIERLTKDSLVVEVNGQKYSAASLKQIRDDRNIKPLNLYTLTGFVDFIKSKSEDVSKCLIVIDDFNKVSLISPIEFSSKKREIFIEAELREENRFPFTIYMDNEDFIIKMNSLMVPNTDSMALIQFASRLTINNSIKSEDDGTTQSVTVNRGMSGALKENAKAPSIVQLQPYRTFREISQPESQFLFRMKAYDGKVPVCALYEADGAEWKNKAIASIKEYLTKQELGLTIIA